MKKFYLSLFKRSNKNTIPKLVSGFSLVEMLVAIGIFMSIMTLAITALISIMGANKKAQTIKSTIDSVTFAMENISKDMRGGTDYVCLPPNGSSKDCPVGGTAVRYKNSSGDTITYAFNGASSNVGILTKTDSTANTTEDLISQDSNVNINNMKFYVIGAYNENAVMADRTQPRVIITVSGLIAVKGSEPTTFNLQTSVSQRVRR